MQTVLPIIAAMVVLSLLSGQHLRAARVNPAGSGYVLTYPRVVLVLALAGTLMAAGGAAFVVYALLTNESAAALMLALVTAPFAALAYYMLKQSFLRIIVDDSGVRMLSGSKNLLIPWGEAKVDATARSQCVVLTNAASQEIRVDDSMVGAGVLDGYIRKRVAPQRIRFIRNLAGEQQLFYREPSNKRLERP
jgi:hypothetical protein